MATHEGTWAYRDRFTEAFGRTYFRRFGERVASSVGIGTYRGEPTDADDDAYRSAVVSALESGINVVDTAINYRSQRSERVVGAAVDAADVDRSATIVATKGGFVPWDDEPPADPGRYVRETYLESGLIDHEALARGRHCIAPAFLDDQLDRSLTNLGLETVDLYYVHNPETQLATRSRAAVYEQLTDAFARLEGRVSDGDIRAYGVATWDAVRVDPGSDRYLSLPRVIECARDAADRVGAETPAFAAIQLPFNVAMADAFTRENHSGPDGPRSALAVARDAGLDVVTSASLAGGDLAAGLPDAVAAELAGETAAQRALNFARSAPGVTTALVGMRSPAHVSEAVAAGRADPVGADGFDAIFA